MTLLELIKGADAVTLNDGPLLNSWTTNEGDHHSDDCVLEFHWQEDGLEFTEEFTAQAIDEATFDGNTITMVSSTDGLSTKLNLFRLVPISPSDEQAPSLKGSARSSSR